MASSNSGRGGNRLTSSSNPPSQNQQQQQRKSPNKLRKMPRKEKSQSHIIFEPKRKGSGSGHAPYFHEMSRGSSVSVPCDSNGIEDDRAISQELNSVGSEYQDNCGCDNGSGRGSITDDITESDYDTDLEIDTDKWIYPEKYDEDSTGITKYERACEEEGIGPIRFFIKHIQDDDLKLKYHGLNSASLRALTVPLENNTTIESIDLEGNWIQAEGTYQLCKVLKENVFVTHLIIAMEFIHKGGNCHIGWFAKKIEFLMHQAHHRERCKLSSGV